MAPCLDLEHVFDAQKGFLRPLVEGRLAVQHIALIGVKSRCGDEVVIEATVVRSTNINKEPVTVTLCLIHQEAEVGKRIKSVSCSCPAGACRSHCCKHAMAVIIYLERNDESNIKELNCTDTHQMWGKLKEETMRKFDPVPITEICHLPKTSIVYQRHKSEVSEDMPLKFKKMYLKDRPTSEATIFWSGKREPKKPSPVPKSRPSQRLVTFFEEHCLKNQHYLVRKMHQLTEDLLAKCTQSQQKYYLVNIAVTENEALHIFLDSQGQNNEIWDGARFGRLTGSTSYSCFTYFMNKNPDWNKKLEGIFEGKFSNNAMDQGHFYKPHALKKYVEEERKKECGNVNSEEVGIVINPLLPWLGFSADAIIFRDDTAYKLWENKTPVKGRTANAVDICNQVSYCDKESGKLKQLHSYYGQVQLGMFLLNLLACDFSIYCTGQVLGKNSVPDPHLQSLHVETLVMNESFCDKYLDRLCHIYFERVLPWLCSKS